jgi:CRP-like cAMP-binding protein
VEKPDKDMFDPKDFLAKVGAGKQLLEFHKNQHVFEQGDVADTVFYIQNGRVKLTVLSEQGKEAVVAILGPGQFFGEGCMNGHALRIATTTAMEDCLITAITKASMIAAMGLTWRPRTASAPLGKCRLSLWSKIRHAPHAGARHCAKRG